MLTEQEELYRVGKFTGSLANAVMNARSEAELLKVWRIKVGLDPPEPETWAMRIGAYVESLILDWLSEQTSPITRRGEIVDHELVSDICVKLDGFRPADDAVVEVKFLAPWRNREEFLPAYYAQCVLACDREYTPVRWSIVSGPYPNLIGAWIAAAILRDEYPDIVWIAGEMYVGEDL